MKRIYDVRWKNINIGEIYEKNEYLVYKPNTKNISSLESDGMPSVLVRKKEKEDIPIFIKNRLKINPNNNNRLMTDYFSINRINQ